MAPAGAIANLKAVCWYLQDKSALHKSTISLLYQQHRQRSQNGKTQLLIARLPQSATDASQHFLLPQTICCPNWCESADLVRAPKVGSSPFHRSSITCHISIVHAKRKNRKLVFAAGAVVLWHVMFGFIDTLPCSDPGPKKITRTRSGFTCSPARAVALITVSNGSSSKPL